MVTSSICTARAIIFYSLKGDVPVERFLDTDTGKPKPFDAVYESMTDAERSLYDSIAGYPDKTRNDILQRKEANLHTGKCQLSTKLYETIKQKAAENPKKKDFRLFILSLGKSHPNELQVKALHFFSPDGTKRSIEQIVYAVCYYVKGTSVWKKILKYSALGLGLVGSLAAASATIYFKSLANKQKGQTGQREFLRFVYKNKELKKAHDNVFQNVHGDILVEFLKDSYMMYKSPDFSNVYRKLSLKYHPDKGGNAPMFNFVASLYKVLKTKKN